jgi:predicted CoA-binding protein
LSTVIRNDEAGAIAEDAGVRYVEDRCRKVEDARLLGRSRRDG